MSPGDHIKFEALRRAWNGLPHNADVQTIIDAARIHEKRLRHEDYEKKAKLGVLKCSL